MSSKKEKQKWCIAYDEDLKDHYGTNCDCIIEKEVIHATFDTRKQAEQYLESCKLKEPKCKPWVGTYYYHDKSSLGHLTWPARVQVYYSDSPIPHNPEPYAK